jgi:PAS domain S-box-containing protein
MRKPESGRNMETSDRQDVYAEQVAQLYALEHIGLIATLVCSSMLVLFHWRVMSRWVLLTWFSALAFITLVRSVVLVVYRRSAGAYNHPRKWGRVFIVGAVFSGIGWGASVTFLFPSGSGQHQLLTLLVLAGMIAGAVGIYSALMGAFVAFAVPASIPMVVQLFFLPHSFEHNTGIMALLFVGFIVTTAQRVNRAVVASLELRLENRDLIAFLAEGKDRAEVLNQSLQVEIAERGKVEAELRRHREQLEKTVEERTAELTAANKLLTQQIDTCRQAEESLLESEEKYRNLFEYSNDCIFLHDLDGRIIDANRKALNEFGFSDSEIQSKNVRDLHPPEVLEAVSRAFEQIRDHGFVNLETSLVRRSGEVFHAEVSSSLFEIRSRQVIQRIVRNITERKIMERELKQTKEYLENVIENAVDAIGIVDREGKFLLWNKRACEIFGYSAEEMSGRHYSSLYADRKARENLLALLRREGVVRQYEIAMLRKDGQEVPIELSLNLLKGDNGETVGSLCLARDLTEKKRLEAQLLHATRMEAVGTLAGGIAHDFNNVLQAIQGYAQLLLLDRKEPEGGYRELQEITRAALRAGDLTKQLLTFSRKLEAKLRPVNLNMEVKQCVRLLERTIPKMIAIELHLARGCRCRLGAGLGGLEGGHFARNFARDGLQVGFLLGCGLLQVGVIHDVVAVKDTPGLVPGHHHSHSLRDSGTHHVPAPGPSQVVKELAGAAGRFASCLPHSIEGPDSLCAPVIQEYPGQGTPEFLPPFPLLLDHAPELGVEVKGPRLIVLGRARLQADDALLPVNLPPGQACDLALAPSRPVSESEDRPEIRGQSSKDTLIVPGLEEPRSRLGSGQRPDERHPVNFGWGLPRA